MSANQVTQLLIVGPSWVEDMVMAQSLFKILRTKDPEGLIDVLAPEWALPLVERMPEVRSGITMPAGHGQLGLRTRYRLGREYRRLDFNQALVLPRTLKSALTFFFRAYSCSNWLSR